MKKIKDKATRIKVEELLNKLEEMIFKEKKCSEELRMKKIKITNRLKISKS